MSKEIMILDLIFKTVDELKQLDSYKELERIMAAIMVIRFRRIYDLEEKENVWANKLIYWGDKLMIDGYKYYKVEDYKKTWDFPMYIDTDTYIGSDLTEEKKELLEVLNGKREESKDSGNVK